MKMMTPNAMDDADDEDDDDDDDDDDGDDDYSFRFVSRDGLPYAIRYATRVGPYAIRYWRR